MEELKEWHKPVVGKYYLVRCAKLDNGSKIIFVPIIGKKHSDPQFGAYWDHYHIDGRFIRFELGPYKVDKHGRTVQAVSAQPGLLNGAGYEFKGVELKRRKCFRLETGIDIKKGGITYLRWYRSMVGKSCKGRICPHRGTVMHERDNGSLVCPLHGLIGDIQNEKIIDIFPDYSIFIENGYKLG